MSEQVARVAGPEDADRVVEILVGAFYDDPTWAWAFPDPTLRRSQQARIWRLLVEGAMRYPSVWLNADATATAVWIPPGGTELSPEQEATLEPLVVELVGAADAPRVLHMFEVFSDNHPTHADFYYLTLLGTAPAHRGKGLGLQLLADTLALPDEDGVAAYLEASNPVNIALYQRYGFKPFASFSVGEGLAEVTTMWRDPHPPQ